MNESTETLQIQRATGEGKQAIEDIVTKELPLTIVFNNQELVTLLSSPVNLDYLAAGYLASEGLIRGKDDIKKIIVDERRGVVHVETVEDKELSGLFKRLITSGCGRGASFYNLDDARGIKVESRTKVSASEVFNLMREFQHRSEVYRATGGVHSAALCDNTGILVFAEDIGRHNAVDKIFGECLLNGIPTADRLLVTSGRISSEILLKVTKRDVPILISKSAPTSLGVRLADNMGVTLIGFARGSRMNIYTNDWRVVIDGK